jgi:hypothetical protein
VLTILIKTAIDSGMLVSCGRQPLGGRFFVVAPPEAKSLLNSLLWMNGRAPFS